MPITKKIFSWCLLLDSIEVFIIRKKRSRPTFEYILFDGFNDTACRYQSVCKTEQANTMQRSNLISVSFNFILFKPSGNRKPHLKPAYTCKGSKAFCRCASLKSRYYCHGSWEKALAQDIPGRMRPARRYRVEKKSIRNVEGVKKLWNGWSCFFFLMLGLVSYAYSSERVP